MRRTRRQTCGKCLAAAICLGWSNIVREAHFVPYFIYFHSFFVSLLPCNMYPCCLLSTIYNLELVLLGHWWGTGYLWTIECKLCKTLIAQSSISVSHDSTYIWSRPDGLLHIKRQYNGAKYDPLTSINFILWTFRSTHPKLHIRCTVITPEQNRSIVEFE